MALLRRDMLLKCACPDISSCVGPSVETDALPNRDTEIHEYCNQHSRLAVFNMLDVITNLMELCIDPRCNSSNFILSSVLSAMFQFTAWLLVPLTMYPSVMEVTVTPITQTSTHYPTTKLHVLCLTDAPCHQISVNTPTSNGKL